MIVSALRPDPRLAGCVIVEIDGDRLASLPVEVVKELGLASGQELAPVRYEALQAAARMDAARRVALRMLSIRPHAVADLARKLRDRNHEPQAAKAALERLEAVGLLNDGDFARHFARVRSPKGHGPSRLVHDLLARGVERGVAERAVAEVATAEEFDPEGAARALAEKRVTALRSLPLPACRRRVLAYLARRGFRSREIREMVEELLKGRGGMQTS